MGDLGKYLMSKVKLPKYIPSQYNAFQLIKICKNREYREDFIAGKLYMSTIKNITDIERRELTKGQCDTIEGTEVYWQSTENNFMAMDFSNEKCVTKYFNKEPKDKTNLIQIYNVEHGRGENIYKNIYCMYSLWIDIRGKQIFNVSPKLIDNFGDYAAIVLEPFELLERYNQAVSNYIDKYKGTFNSTPSIGFINYIHFKNKGIIPLGVYRKSDDFIYQNEFRFCLDIKGNKGDLCYFEIGDLSDIVMKIRTTDLVNNIGIDGDYLVIGDKKINFNLSK